MDRLVLVVALRFGHAEFGATARMRWALRVAFALWSGWCIALGHSPDPSVEGQQEKPVQVWINYGRNPSQMVVSWISRRKAASIVEFHGEDETVSQLAIGVRRKSHTGRRHTHSGTVHHALLTQLKPNTRYSYRVGDPAVGMRDSLSFQSHPGVGPSIAHTMGFVGDIGTSGEAKKLIHAVVDRRKIDSLQLLGDFSYGRSNEKVWDAWGHMMEPLTAHVPTHVALGNHDTIDVYQNRWMMPFRPQDEVTRNLFYSYKVGPAKMIVLSPYHKTKNDSNAQQEFLERELRSINRTETPWVFAAFHAPIYNSNQYHFLSSRPKRLRRRWEDLFYNRVDAVFAGHVHAYERFERVYRGQPDSAGPYYFTVGTGGRSFGSSIIWHAVQPGSMVRITKYGYGELRLNGTSAIWRWFDVSSGLAQEDDSTVLEPARAPTPSPSTVAAPVPASHSQTPPHTGGRRSYRGTHRAALELYRWVVGGPA